MLLLDADQPHLGLPVSGRGILDLWPAVASCLHCPSVQGLLLWMAMLLLELKGVPMETLRSNQHS